MQKDNQNKESLVEGRSTSQSFISCLKFVLSFQDIIINRDAFFYCMILGAPFLPAVLMWPLDWETM